MSGQATRTSGWHSPDWHPLRQARGINLLAGLVTFLAFLLGGGIELLAHHDHEPFVADHGCVMCRLADASVDGAPPAPVVPEVFEAPIEFRPLAPCFRPVEPIVDAAHPLRGPPQV